MCIRELCFRRNRKETNECRQHEEILKYEELCKTLAERHLHELDGYDRSEPVVKGYDEEDPFLQKIKHFYKQRKNFPAGHFRLPNRFLKESSLDTSLYKNW